MRPEAPPRAIRPRDAAGRPSVRRIRYAYEIDAYGGDPGDRQAARPWPGDGPYGEGTDDDGPGSDGGAPPGGPKR